MNSIFVGQRDLFQNDDNLFMFVDQSLCRLDHEFNITPEYPLSLPLKPSSLPPDIWSNILDIVILEYLTEFNYHLVARLLRLSKGFMFEFYNLYFGKDTHIDHSVGATRCYFRISHTLKTLDLMIDQLFEGFTFRVNLFLNPAWEDEIPMPWDISQVNRDFSGASHTKIYNPVNKKIREPWTFKLGDGFAFISGSIKRSIIKPNYFRLPIVIMSLTGTRDTPPLMTLSFLQKSHSWLALSRLLRPGLGVASGIYHSVNTTSLPIEFVFDEEVLIES